MKASIYQLLLQRLHYNVFKIVVMIMCDGFAVVRVFLILLIYSTRISFHLRRISLGVGLSRQTDNTAGLRRFHPICVPTAVGHHDLMTLILISA